MTAIWRTALATAKCDVLAPFVSSMPPGEKGSLGARRDLPLRIESSVDAEIEYLQQYRG